ncbi:putative signal transducing protein [Pseudomonas sp. HK3]
MKRLYEAQNSIEAHMILNLLEQSGLTGRVDGEHLQGGVGEIQMSGIVRVMVEDADYEEALSIIEQWDAKQPEIKENIKIVTKRKNSLLMMVIGFLIGVACTFYYYDVTPEFDGADNNKDGNLDEFWTYVNGYLREAKVDRNFDGEMDLIITYDRFGKLKTSVSDDDFNGTFETTMDYEFGNVISMKSDTTGDGFKDVQTQYLNGGGAITQLLTPETKAIRLIQKFNAFKLYESHFDSNDDGVLDTMHRYDEYEQIIETIKK